MALSCRCLVLVALAASGAASQQCDGADPSGQTLENATILIQARRTVASSSSSHDPPYADGHNYDYYALWPNDARRRTHAPANGRECSTPRDCKDEAMCSNDGKKCKTCSLGASCYSAFERQDNRDREPVTDVDSVPTDYNDTLFVCACNVEGSYPTMCTDHTHCTKESGCREGSGAMYKRCGDCTKGRSCSGKYDLQDPDPRRAFCYCGSDRNGAAQCGGRWGDCKGDFSCDTSSGIGTKKCRDCNSGYRCKKNDGANVGKCKCKR